MSSVPMETGGPSFQPVSAQERLGEILDSLMRTDFGGRGVVGALYQAVRQKTGRPLVLNAAQVLMDALAPGRVALLATGFPVRPWVSPAIGETDGPPGVAGLARALSVGLQAIPVIAVPQPMAPQVRTALTACGLLVLSLEEARNAVTGSRPTGCAVICERPVGGQTDVEGEHALMRTLAPAALLAVEHPGCNTLGTCHSSMGVDISAGVAFAETLFEIAGQQGLPRLSFIDNVNEIGVGSIEPTLLQALDPEGILTGTSPVDHIVVAAVANWGAYATVAALAALLDKPGMLWSRDQDKACIAAVMQAGGVEGVSGSAWPEDGVDAIPTWISGHMVDLLAYVSRSYKDIQARGRY